MAAAEKFIPRDKKIVEYYKKCTNLRGTISGEVIKSQCSPAYDYWFKRGLVLFLSDYLSHFSSMLYGDLSSPHQQITQ